MNTKELTVKDYEKMAEKLRQGTQRVTQEHPTFELLSRYAYGELPETEMPQLDAHIDFCEQCSGEVEQLLFFRECEAEARANPDSVPQSRLNIDELIEQHRPLWDKFQHWVGDLLVQLAQPVALGAPDEEWQEFQVNSLAGGSLRATYQASKVTGSIDLYLFADQADWAGNKHTLTLKFVSASRPEFEWNLTAEIVFDEDDTEKEMKVSALLRIAPEDFASWPEDVRLVVVE